MNTGPAVIVNKRGGFLSALAFGFFGLLTTTIVCASGLGFYGLYVVNGNANEIVKLGKDLGLGVLDGFPEWIDALPPVLTDAFNDRRDPTYRNELNVDAIVVRETDGRSRAIVTVRNSGDETVSLLMARIVFRNEQGVPVHEYTKPIATPLSFDDRDWPGPILPGSERVVSVPLRSRTQDELSATVELTEIRLWNADGGELVQALPKSE